MSRRISATWWYTFGGVVFFDLILVLLVLSAAVGRGHSPVGTLAVLVAGVLWTAANVPLLLDYRTRVETAAPGRWLPAAIALALAVALGVTAGVHTGVWLLAAAPTMQTLVLLAWPPGIRVRVVVAVTALLVGLWVIDVQLTIPADETGQWAMLAVFCASIPAMTVFTLWWWDLLVVLDQARASEARLGATQERLRVATDVHDLQGHHLQVIALQLELAERLLAEQPDAALEHLRMARASVDDARQGTRDLALQFRSASLIDELGNAVDLLRAAGMDVDASVPPQADSAPGDALAPVVREATTNVLRHGGGVWARVSLSDQQGTWRFELTNDAGATDACGDPGSGLDGIRRRISEAGGTVDVSRDKHSFTLVATVPAREAGAR